MEKLKWKVIHNTKFSQEYDFLTTILESNGVEDVDAFLNVNHNNIFSPFLMRNMDKGIALLHEKMKLGEPKILLKVDPDVDGATSSSVILQFIETIKPDAVIKVLHSEGKEHGLTVDMYNGDYDLVIVPDASLEDSAKWLEKKNNLDLNTPILILDHHGYNEWQNECATYICCTDEKYPNPNLTGVGVVQKFIEGYVDTYDLDKGLKRQWLDLVALGLIADSADARSLETRYYMLEGMKEDNIHNEFIKELSLAVEYETKGANTIMTWGWYIAPRINGSIRFGKKEEKEDMFDALCGVQRTIEYQPRRKRKTDPLPPLEYHSLQKTMARVCGNIKTRQDNQVRKFMKEIDAKIKETHLDKNSVIIVDGTDILKKVKTVTGLVANKLTNVYRRPVVLLRKQDEETFGGSCRGYDKGNIDNIQDFLMSTNSFDKVEGHANAAGIVIRQDKVQEAINKCNKLVPLEKMETIYTVDYEIKGNELRPRDVLEVGQNAYLFGNHVPEPLFAITDIHINASDIQAYGENNGFIRFVYNGVTYVKKYCPKGDYERMTMQSRIGLGNKKNLKMTVLAQFKQNEYEGKFYPEVKISNYYVEEEKITTEVDDDFDF